MPVWEETPGQTKDMLERLCFSAGLGVPPTLGCRLGVPPKELVELAREESVWISLLMQLPLVTRTQIGRRK